MDTGWSTGTEPTSNLLLPSDSSKGRSETIPLPTTHIPKTQSELQLSEDMAMAEWRDLCMFYRVANGGTRERQPPRVPRHCQPGEALDSTVTPYDSSNEVSPHLSRFKEHYEKAQIKGFLNPTVAVDMVARAPSNDWSISGYSEEDNVPHQTVANVAVVERYEDDREAIFDMDL